MMNRLVEEAHKAGFGIRRATGSIWIHASGIEPFLRAEPLIRGIRQRVVDHQLLFTSADRATVKWLRSRFPNDLALPVPAAFGFSRFLSRTAPHLLISLACKEGLPEKVMTRVRKAGIPLTVMIGTESSGLWESALPRVREHARARRPWRKLTLRDQFGECAFWRKVSEFLAGSRIENWAQLKTELGSPRRILCLGNGPSSEDERLLDVSFDCLMRVNWRWACRGFLNKPDVVFAGEMYTLNRVRGPCIFGFWAKRQESGALLRNLLAGGFRPLRYFSFEQLSGIDEREWDVQPTNGAIMIACAAALEPESLVIGGIDLFEHPAGRYPGDAAGTNEYAQAHSRECDLHTIRRVLDGYRGEVIIIGEALRAALSGKEEIRTARTGAQS